MKRILRPTLALIALTLAACGTLPMLEEPALPVSGNNAVVALVDSARNDTAGGRLDVAASTLERALRIEPRNPGLWHELAKTRLQQGNATQAISLAAKSNAWSGANKSLRAANWRLIGEARTQLGDSAGAQAAFDTAAQLQH
jgi:cytochrome c-type biogenesis protein CcmH/NrfG